MNGLNRRPVKSRGQKIFQDFAVWLVKRGFTPNQISIFSSVCAFVGAAAFLLAARTDGLWIYLWAFVALVGIQGRLVCNLLDGLMAVEGGLKTPTGELYNEIPDRVSDTLIFLGAAYGTLNSNIHMLGWLASLLAMATAYLRVLGAASGTRHFFAGPMAKQHRMFIMNICLIASVIEIKILGTWELSVGIALAVICLGSLLTCVRRLQLISQTLNNHK
jgi:phosphatidylglycerophosphate synthase